VGGGTPLLPPCHYSTCTVIVRPAENASGAHSITQECCHQRLARRRVARRRTRCSRCGIVRSADLVALVAVRDSVPLTLFVVFVDLIIDTIADIDAVVVAIAFLWCACVVVVCVIVAFIVVDLVSAALPARDTTARCEFPCVD